jgi:fused signal recognition particle receptor
MQLDAVQWLILGIVVVLVVAVAWTLLSRRSRPVASTEKSVPVRRGLASSLRAAWSGGLDDSTWEGIEEALLAADVGFAATSEVVDSVRRGRPETYEDAIGQLAANLRSQFHSDSRDLVLDGAPAVVVVVGVNGSGKTTTIAKLAKQLSDRGQTVVLGAADTFRAAAADQLAAWGSRIGVRVVTGNEGADPASVVFDALSAARADSADVVVVDTAGRLHGKKNLMAELSKIHRVATQDGTQPAETLLVLDATTGQNGLAQVAEFSQSVPLTGVVLTKLDGTARGGIVIAVEKNLGVPIKFVGVGEGVDDLRPFDPQSFVDDLLEAS